MPANTSVYRHKKSPYWIVAYLEPRTRRRKILTSPFRVDDENGYRHALALAAEKSREFQKFRAVAKAERWENWVLTFIRDTFAHPAQADTLGRYERAWTVLCEFLEEEDVQVPLALQHIHCVRFVKWRTAQKRNSGKPIAKNTALLELKVLRLVMQEAVRRGYAQGNPCLSHGIAKAPVKQKPEMNDTEIALIRAALAEKEGKRPLPQRWMTISFEIAITQGCRLQETSVPLSAIDLAAKTIRFEAKGRNGVKNIFTTRLHDSLVPLVEQLRAEGATRTCTLPPRASLEWWEFFREHGLGHLCFHCTRVTVITRLARAGVPVQQAMRYVGHASETVHAIYQRLQAPDLGLAAAALAGLGAASGRLGSGQIPGGGGATS